jgi:hypothetical protein
MTRLRSALWLPIFDDLAEPAAVAGLAADAEEAGWHGVFVWGQPALAGAGPASRFPWRPWAACGGQEV